MMAAFYLVEPEVAGGWGKNTSFTRVPGTRTTVHKLHYEFNGWLGDSLLESTPCYIATEAASRAIANAHLSGVTFDGVEVSTSAEFEELCPGVQLPPFIRLNFGGNPGIDDFGVTSQLSLVVSEKAFIVLKEQGIANALVKPFEA
jgi:hypothetical protein